MAAAGWEVRYLPIARVHHHEGQSSGQNVAARHILFHRARVAYFRKHHGRLVAAAVRLGVLVQFAVELVLEAIKLAAGNKPDLRRERIGQYRRILADGLAPAGDTAGEAPVPAVTGVTSAPSS
jgi:GT2 family glycosyltransferase